MQEQPIDGLTGASLTRFLLYSLTQPQLLSTKQVFQTVAYLARQSLEQLMALHGYTRNLDVLILSTIRSFSQTLAGLKRLLAAPPKNEQPIESHQVRALIRSYGRPRASLPNLQMVSLVALGFCAFLCWSELRDLRACDLKFYATHTSVFLDKRKNDELCQGSVIEVARLPSSSCPVKLLELFHQRGEHQPSQSLFRLCQKLSTGYKLRQAPLSYSRAREQFRQMISELGLDPNEFGLHSLCSGGASQAARSGVSGRVWRRHGGWRSIQAADGYVNESLDNTLVVSRDLAL